MTEIKVAQAVIEESEGKTVLHIGNLTIKFNEGADEFGPLNATDDSAPSHGITVWENEYVKADGQTIEYSGGPLIDKFKLDDSPIEKERIEKMRQMLP